MDTAQWPQEMALVKPPSPMEDMVSSSTRPHQLMERRTRPQKEQALNCPRCNSTNTKFCYYNNYSLTQPRYFCKTCRRYWTEGGSLRNVPVGGGSRKNKRSSSNSSSTINTTTTTTTSSLQAPSSAPNSKKFASDNLISTAISSSTQNSKFLERHDLNLAFPHHSPNLAGEYGDFHNMNINSTNSSNPSTCSSSSTSAAASGSALSAMELLRSGGVSSRGLMNPFIPMPIVHEGSAVYPTGGFGLQDFRSTTLNFPVDGISGGSVYGQNNMQEVGDRVLFPFEDLRQVSSNPSEQFEQNRGQGGDSSGFWNGVMGGGTPW